MSKSVETRTARFDHQCAKCYKVIPKGSEYIAVIYHSVKSVPISKKLYGGRQYYQHIHSNSTSTYHSECYVG